ARGLLPRWSMHLLTLGYVAAVRQHLEYFAYAGVPDWLRGTVFQKVLLGDIGDVLGSRVLGDQMIVGLILARPALFGNGLVPFLAIVELLIDVENHARKREQSMAHYLSDREFGRLHYRDRSNLFFYLAQRRYQFNPVPTDVPDFVFPSSKAGCTIPSGALPPTCFRS